MREGKGSFDSAVCQPDAGLLRQEHTGSPDVEKKGTRLSLCPARDLKPTE